MKRTLIVSDLHGYPALLEGALDDAGFVAEADRLVVAGDTIDIGPQQGALLRRLADLGGEMLVGNHEIAGALAIPAPPQSRETLRHARQYVDRIQAGEWRLAAEVSGWLVTHAGVSAAFVEEQGIDGGVDEVVSTLNRALKTELCAALNAGPADLSELARWPVIGGAAGPIWLRPTIDSVPSDYKQIVGHSPKELIGKEEATALAAADFLIADPCARCNASTAGFFRYVLVDPDGTASLRESATPGEAYAQ